MNHPSPLTEDRTLCTLEQYSFSDEAAQIVRAQHPQLTMRYAQNIEGVWSSITKDNALGMIPFENSSGGVVWPHLERLMNEGQPLQIAAAVRMQVRMCVGGVKGAELRTARNIHSHPKALQQSSRFIASLSELKQVEHGSTVSGVKAAVEQPDAIALASRTAIEAHGLHLLAEDVADLPGEKNVTKFFVVHKNGHEDLPVTSRMNHAAIITPHDKVGVLAGVLNQIASNDVNLVSIHSRSIGDHEYAFYLEMERRGTEAEMNALSQWMKVSSSIRSVKWLGSWNVHLSNTASAKQ